MENWYDKLTAVLRQYGYSLYKRKASSHEKWINFSTNKRVTVATSLNSRNMANKILNQADIDYRFK
jgi:hypothetical protein